MEAAEEPAREINRLSEEVSRLEERAASEIRTAHRAVDVVLDAAASSRSEADKARGILASIS